jgi:hypothetical protein
MKTRTLLLSSSLCAILIACGGGQDASTPSKYSGRLFSATETAVFSGPRSNYTLTKTSSGYTVKDNVGSEGTRTVSEVQALKFSDVTVNLTIASKASTITPANLTSLIELYIAFFNRVPDADGLGYWIDQFNSGMSIDQIADSFYNAAVQYTSLTGYSPTMTNEDFVRVIYKNVLGRSGATAPPDEDVNYWASNLASGAATKGSLVKTMLSSAHSFKGDGTWGWVADLLDNKATVANYFAIQEGLNYNTSSESISKGMAIAAAVTSTNTTDAIALIDQSSSTLSSSINTKLIDKEWQFLYLYSDKFFAECHRTSEFYRGYCAPQYDHHLLDERSSERE